MMLRSVRIPPPVLVCLALLLSGPVQAQSPSEATAAQPLPDWVVLVLKPIGADRVRPVSGVVVSGDGLVMVPLDFASPGDQIIILDGGTDIIENGRAATVWAQLGTAGVTIVHAPALKRSPAPLSAAALKTGDQVELLAFPPAELISKGSAPVRAVSPLVLAEAGNAVSLQTALPNVSGALVDSCGNLVGFSSSDGVQSIDRTASPTYLWQTELKSALSAQSIDLPERPCPLPPVENNAEPVAAAVDQTAEPEPGLAMEEIPADHGQGASFVSAAEDSDNNGQSTEFAWYGYVLALLALVAVGSGWFALRRYRNAEAVPSLLRDAEVRLPRDGRKLAEMEERNPVLSADSVFEINGRLASGKPFLASCPVSSAAVDVVIGRSGADLVVDSAELSREHARFSGSAGLLTITDLGSSRGTWINRVPCLKGEIMFVTPQDMIFMGDVSFRVDVRPGVSAGKAHHEQ